jgi:hypothetical protein
MTDTMTSPAAVSPSAAPGRIWYVVALIVFCAGFGVMAMIIVSRIGGAAERMMRVAVPGTLQLALDQTGTYTIFHEHRSVLDGQVYAVDGVMGLRIAVRSNATSELLPLRSTAGANYAFGSYAGRSLFDFEIDAPGTYELSASYADGRDQPRTVLAVGRGFVGDLLTTVLLSLVAAFTGAGLATTLAVVVFLKRRKVLKGSA